MAEEFQDLLHEDLDIQVRDYSIQRLALHRHFPKLGEVGMHTHKHDQTLLYLRGHGVQILADEEIQIRRGSLIFLPRESKHGFRREREQSPVCLALDFLCPDPAGWKQHCIISNELLGRIETYARTMADMQSGLQIASIIIEILMWQHEIAHSEIPRTGQWTNRVRSYIKKQDIQTLTVTNIAVALELNPDVLNRHLRRESNLSLNQIISIARLDIAEQLLQDRKLSISEIGSKIGIDDQNYFSRWFRKQTGQTPSNWRKSHDI